MTTITPDSVRQEIHWQDDDGATVSDRILGPMKRLIESFVGRRIDYAQMYPSKVNAQNGDGTLDITPDDERMRGDGLKNIAITYGLPGVTATIPSGGKVNLYFRNGDPKEPRAALFEGSGVTTVEVGGGTEPVLRGDAFVSALDTFVDALNVYIVIPVPTAPQTATWADAVVAFKLVLSTTAKSTTIKGP